MASGSIRAPDLRETLGSVLHSLPPATMASQPPETILPFLSPILRQRLQLLSAASSDPWIRLLCYDAANAARLAEIAQSDRLEPHPVSGEVEVDWDYDAEIRYRRLDEETLQALAVLQEKELSFRLVYCTGEADGWKVGEVSCAEGPSPFSSFGGVSSIAEADRQFQESQSKKKSLAVPPQKTTVSHADQPEDDDDDDDYWARYDATPARTPAANMSPAPESTQGKTAMGDDDDYYAQYDSVQPAMDPHDPDEEANLGDAAPPPLGLSSRPTHSALNGRHEEETELNETNGAWTLAEPPRSPSVGSRGGDDPKLVHPRPESSASSNASVAKLEAAAENFGVQQHISRSIKSLYMLSRASGIERAEFELIVKRELDMLGLMED
ncbi:hypothetical protein JX265_005428 [Neoarthrinium moseri]|uniref:Uncharacterized protein n=1 Tax=Neoarthrinium moseri TaxID=1658444 RepID=A0A9P9WNU2_9PEZI|nr:uncharacterized protein JN550_009352 [Neoarthrinium moseri]KAI1845273.1 hypothetical protein JX266_008583 [Neoarthrinium moseri]KAI1863854.1 hypothetical protein JN550_009352 [Neoarthrinium moseri]KAI1872548.1 hypothetical protein JX265_005428 [Neoarthrinium moseri]